MCLAPIMCSYSARINMPKFALPQVKMPRALQPLLPIARPQRAKACAAFFSSKYFPRHGLSFPLPIAAAYPVFCHNACAASRMALSRLVLRTPSMAGLLLQQRANARTHHHSRLPRSWACWGLCCSSASSLPYPPLLLHPYPVLSTCYFCPGPFFLLHIFALFILRLNLPCINTNFSPTSNLAFGLSLPTTVGALKLLALPTLHSEIGFLFPHSHPSLSLLSLPESRFSGSNIARRVKRGEVEG
ncbi:hypothetical protein V8C35DRAFT_293014 [Trichoderma chlorosporum]